MSGWLRKKKKKKRTTRTRLAERYSANIKKSYDMRMLRIGTAGGG